VARLLLFVHDEAASIAPPRLALRAFARLPLGPGETGSHRFHLDRGAFALLDADLRPVVEPGSFEVLVGLTADPAALRRVRFDLG
jgi:beta-glucosidase